MDKNENEIDRWLEEIARVLAECTDPDLIRGFVSSILTPTELKEVATRWALVRLLDSGMSQRKIAAALGLSLCKITRGSKELKRENSPFGRMIRTYDRVSTAG